MAHWFNASRLALFAAAVLFLLAAQVSGTRANPTVDFVVDALAASAGSAGYSVNQTTRTIVKQVVGDVVDGKFDAVDSLKNAVLSPLMSQLPPETQKLARCIAKGTSIPQCAIGQLPEDMQKQISQVANCVMTAKGAQDCVKSVVPEKYKQLFDCVAAQNRLDTCAEQEAIRQIKDPQVRRAAECLAAGSKVANCAQQYATAQVADAISQLENPVQNSVDKFMKPAKSTIENIVNVVIAVQQEDWLAVLQNAGAAAGKEVVRHTLYNAAPWLRPLVGGLIDRIIEDRIDLVNSLFRTAKEGNIPAATQVIVEAYLTLQVEMSCSIDIIPVEIRQAVCGPLGDIIRSIGKAANAVTNDVIELVKTFFDDPTKVPSEIVRRIGKDDDCGTAENYYAQRFVTCYAEGEHRILMSQPGKTYTELVDALNLQCRQYFAQCFFKTTVFDSGDNLAKICEPMRDLYRGQVQQIDTAVKDAAARYSKTVTQYINSRGSQTCDSEFKTWGYQDFVGLCGNGVEKQIPLSRPNSNFSMPLDKTNPYMPAPNCTIRPGETMNFSIASVGKEACEKAITPAMFETEVNRARSSFCILPRPPLPNPSGAAVPAPVLNPSAPLPSGFATSRAAGALGGSPVPPAAFDTGVVTATRPAHNTAVSITERGGAATSGPVARPNPFPPAQANVPSGGAVACPPGTRYINGSCSGGGPYSVQPGGQSYNPQGQPIPAQPRQVPSSGTAVACPPGTSYFNGSCSGGGPYSVQPGGQSYAPPGRPVPQPGVNPNTPMGTRAGTGAVTPQVQTGGTISNARPGSVTAIQNQSSQTTLRTIDYERMRKKRLQQQQMDFNSTIR